MGDALSAPVCSSTSLPAFPRILSPPSVVTKPCILPVKVHLFSSSFETTFHDAYIDHMPPINSDMRSMIHPNRSPDARIFRILQGHRPQPPHVRIRNRFRERSSEDGSEATQFVQAVSPTSKGERHWGSLVTNRTSRKKRTRRCSCPPSQSCPFPSTPRTTRCTPHTSLLRTE
ncbi:hypothetical protein BDM02DRAFT_3122808 [Thelephora ganbajun]|uniref:Uncharacterized protein n=1 Tax=Thelephora ganbajun TaxID=370292 RepID=A0ACB6Z2I2_THEGA|nr:hypothetical protein BDM02DRAFT_3122808 [Thelephora ganbajun]